MCPICRKRFKEVKVAAGHGEEVHPECYEPYLAFVKAVEEAYTEYRKKKKS